jgi:septal ring factor EnvC (AmiA/AmiB activator)
MNKMRTRRIALLLLTMLAGCRAVKERIIYEPAQAPAQVPAEPAPVPASPEVIERRFVAQDTQPDAVQSAVTWAAKYEQLAVQNTDLREKHNQLFLQNAQLTQQLDAAKAELERTRKELNEANAFLQEMHVELNKWKADVLGYREEMRQAQKAQLEALSRILQVLGAEPVKPAAQ